MDDTGDRTNRQKNLVGFQVGDVCYAVDIFSVREIIHPLSLVDLPHAPEAVLGVADHRGEVVPVIDLRKRFGVESIAPLAFSRPKWIIVDVRGRSVGLLVDLVTDVFGRAPADHREVPALGSGDDIRGISDVYMHEGSLVFVIDVDRVADAAAEIDVSSIAPSSIPAEGKRG